MRIKVKTLKTLVFAGVLAIGGIFAGGMISKKTSSRAAFGETAKVGDYTCTDCVFGSTHNGNAYSGSTTTEISTDIFGISNYKNTLHAPTYTSNPLKLGATHSGTSSKDKDYGSFDVTFKNGYTCDQVFVYACCWPGDTKAASTLTIGDTTRELEQIADASDINFNMFVFNFAKTNKITISNSENRSNNHRILISKLVFRVYEA